MIEKLPDTCEQSKVVRPRLMRGLFETAKNAIVYGIERVNYELNPDPDADIPTRKRSY